MDLEFGAAGEIPDRNSQRKPISLLNKVLSGSIIGANNSSCCIALAAFVFVGDLKSYLPMGIGLFCWAMPSSAHLPACAQAPVYGLATLQESSIAIVSLMASSITVKTEDHWSILPTVVVAIAISTALLGITLLALGYFRLGIVV